MAEIKSALASVYETGRKGAGSGDAAVSVKEITGRDIVQLAAWPDTVRGYGHIRQTHADAAMKERSRWQQAMNHPEPSSLRAA